MATKIFILSSNALASSPNSCLRFEDNIVVIPGIVIDELNKIAEQYNTKGKNAQNVLKYLDSFNFNELISEKGVMQKNGGILRVEYGYNEVNISVETNSKSEYRRLQIALGLKETNPKKPVILISRNTAFRLKAKSLGIKAADYKDEVFPAIDQQYKGRISSTTTLENLEFFDKENYIDIKKIHKNSTFEWITNEFVEFCDINNPHNMRIGRYDGSKIVGLNYNHYYPYGIMAKNAGQKMLIEALLTSCDLAPIVIVKGGAGTGKTYQTLACALDQTVENNTYDSIMISTSVSTVGGEEIGFLPGEIEDKFSPHIGGFKDNLRILVNGRNKKKNKNKDNNDDNTFYYYEDGTIQMQPIGFFRGRTIVDTFIIIDETQNIHPDDIKSIVSRVGEGSKIIFLGDPTQIDNPKLDERYNGLVFLSEKMKDYPKAWQITLNDEESVRSELAKYAAKIL
ncbi:MAG: PhoH family protein [Clostridia bacterium]|nr:PhoH family protein [Clostridia bacterium]